MKRSTLSLLVVLTLACPTLAQSGFSVRANAAVVQLFFDDWSDQYDPHDPLAYWDTFRCALGLKYQCDVAGHLDMYASADFLYRDASRKLSKHMARWTPDEVLPSSINFPVMVGLNYSVFEIPSSGALWLECGAGLNFRRIAAEHFAHTATAPTLVGSSHMGATPVWKAGLGVTAGRYSLELAYTSFGSRELSSAPSYVYHYFIKQHYSSMLYFSLGLHF